MPNKNVSNGWLGYPRRRWLAVADSLSEFGHGKHFRGVGQFGAATAGSVRWEVTDTDPTATVYSNKGLIEATGYMSYHGKARRTGRRKRGATTLRGSGRLIVEFSSITIGYSIDL